MENEQFKGVGIDLGSLLFIAFSPVFASESFYNAAEFKKWLGQGIKSGAFAKYENLEWKDYRVVLDLLMPDGQTFHVGIDFGQQAVHVTLGPGDVHSLYYRNPWTE